MNVNNDTLVEIIIILACDHKYIIKRLSGILCAFDLLFTCTIF